MKTGNATRRLVLIFLLLLSSPTMAQVEPLGQDTSPEGRLLAVRLPEDLESIGNQPVYGVIDEDLRIGDRLLIPRGTAVRGRLSGVDLSAGEAAYGSLELLAYLRDDRWYSMQTGSTTLFLSPPSRGRFSGRKLLVTGLLLAGAAASASGCQSRSGGERAYTEIAPILDDLFTQRVRGRVVQFRMESLAVPKPD